MAREAHVYKTLWPTVRPAFSPVWSAGVNWGPSCRDAGQCGRGGAHSPSAHRARAGAAHCQCGGGSGGATDLSRRGRSRSHGNRASGALGPAIQLLPGPDLCRWARWPAAARGASNGVDPHGDAGCSNCGRGRGRRRYGAPSVDEFIEASTSSLRRLALGRRYGVVVCLPWLSDHLGLDEACMCVIPPAGFGQQGSSTGHVRATATAAVATAAAPTAPAAPFMAHVGTHGGWVRGGGCRRRHAVVLTIVSARGLGGP